MRVICNERSLAFTGVSNYIYHIYVGRLSIHGLSWMLRKVLLFLMKDLKILILLFYYARPKLVQNLLNSILDSTYKNCEVAFIDDTENSWEGYKVYRTFVPEFMKADIKFGYVHTKDTDEAKGTRGGSNFGKFANQVMLESDADLAIMGCDDDGVYPTYLEHINKYYQENPEVMYSYGHIILFNPWEEDFNEVKTRTEASAYLNWQHDIHPFCQLDSSQVSWNLKECNKAGITFPFPKTNNLDADIYAKMAEAWGLCKFNQGISQYKGWSLDTKVGQLGKRSCPYEGAE